jgi:hypothetical protein
MEKDHRQNIVFVSQVTDCTFQISTATACLSRLVQTVHYLTTFASTCYSPEQTLNPHDADYRTHSPSIGNEAINLDQVSVTQEM